MLRTRIIPALLLREESLVKTVRYENFSYIGDPCNTVRIFNELEVDELIFLDILASTQNKSPNFDLITDIANECFMPLAYGGGISKFDDAKRLFDIGIEKISINSANFSNPQLMTDISKHYGAQAVIGSMDVKKSFFKGQKVFKTNAKDNTGYDPVKWAKQLENMGAGEILLTSVDQEGTWNGFDLELVQAVSEAVSIPVIAHGGGANVGDIGKVVNEAQASAVALGSMVVFQKKDMGVLISFPDQEELQAVLT